MTKSFAWRGLEGQRALVTGGSGGIGSTIVESLLAAGARVVNVDCKGPGPKGSELFPCDLSDPQAIAALQAPIAGAFDGLDIFVHAAGITRDGVHWKMTDEDWLQVMQVNLHSAFQLLKMCTPLMRKSGKGSVVLISSINGERGKFGQSNYAASKAGLIGFARSAARELGRFAVRVNVVAPGWIRTTMTQRLPQQFRQDAERESALGKIGDPSDVAGAVLFLVSDWSRHVTGQVLRVDGGQLMA